VPRINIKQEAYVDLKKIQLKMKKKYKNQLSEMFFFEEEDIEKLMGAISIKEIPSGTVLLSEGEIATRLFLVIQGCLRQYFIKENGNEITSQFFIENQMVVSFESAMTKTPSRVYIGAVENSIIGIIPIEIMKIELSEKKTFKDDFTRFLIKRLIYYINHHASYILDSPEERYKNLVKETPELVSRLPKQYIASYLGITPVSLSRIRSRLKKLK
jgi:CRP-like cAMP-binding protein